MSIKNAIELIFFNLFAFLKLFIDVLFFVTLFDYCI